jgi:hypothetical protein
MCVCVCVYAQCALKLQQLPQCGTASAVYTLGDDVHDTAKTCRMLDASVVTSRCTLSSAAICSKSTVSIVAAVLSSVECC